MAGFKNEQRHIQLRGKVFHFISYEAHDAIPSKKVQAMPATWYLISANNRWPAIPHVADQDPMEVDDLLTEWLEEHVLAPKVNLA
jgi:hypothetical protein